MKRMIRFAFVLAMLSVCTVSAFASDTAVGLKSKMKQMMQENPEIMQELMANPNHRLAMGYRNNLMNFAQVLKKAAQTSTTIPGSFARTAIGEMRRSVDLLEKEHEAVLNSIPAEKKALLGEIPKLMHEHLADVHKRLDHLNQLAKEDQVPSKEVLKDLDFILEHCQVAMKGMNHRPGTMGHQDLQEKSERDAELEGLVQRMNQAPDNEKVGLMAEILTRMVETQKGMSMPMQGMTPYGHPKMHPQMNHQSVHPDLDDDGDMNMDENMDGEEME